MARIRTIKPDFFTSLTVAELSSQARLTFIGLWTHVDDEGRCVDEARLIAAALWPLDDNVGASTVDGHLEDLERLGLIVRYRVGGRAYLAVTGWEEHQRINRKTDSELPGPEDADIDDADTHSEDSLSAHGGRSEDVHREGKGTGNREQGTKTAADAADPDEEIRTADQRFEDHFWPDYPARKGRKRGKPNARREWHKLTIDEQRRAVVGARNLAKSDEFPKDPERFLRAKGGHFPFDDYQQPVTVDKATGQVRTIDTTPTCVHCQQAVDAHDDGMCDNGRAEAA